MGGEGDVVHSHQQEVLTSLHKVELLKCSFGEKNVEITKLKSLRIEFPDGVCTVWNQQ